MKKMLCLVLVLMMALPAVAQAANCTPQTRACGGASCTDARCPKSTCAKTKCPSAGCGAKGCPSSAAKPVNQGTKVNGTSMSSMAAQVVAETNMERAKAGLAPLSVDADLSAAACTRAKEIVSKFSHTRPNGQNALGISSKAFGENIAKGQQSVGKVMAAWMSSSGHKANILRSSYRSIGVCAYQVNGIMYWVQLFGR